MRMCGSVGDAKESKDVSRVGDLSVKGLFLSTSTTRRRGARAKIDFLVPEGQIRAEAVVQHQVHDGGLGLRFTAITDQDCPNMLALMNRISAPSTPPREN